MSDLTELQQRVEQAEQRFGLLGTHQAKASARLIELMDRIERQAAERQQEVEGYLGEIAQARRERDQVKQMLQDLLHAIEANSHDVLNDTLHALDRRAAAILGETPAGGQTSSTVVPFSGRFEDVNAAELEAEARAESGAAAETADTVDSEVGAAVASETAYAPKLPTALAAEAVEPEADSPIGEVIERIALLTRALVQTRTPSEERAAAAAADEVRHIA
jgi:hypothetical protein